MSRKDADSDKHYGNMSESQKPRLARKSSIHEAKSGDESEYTYVSVSNMSNNIGTMRMKSVVSEVKNPRFVSSKGNSRENKESDLEEIKQNCEHNFSDAENNNLERNHSLQRSENSYSMTPTNPPQFKGA